MAEIAISTALSNDELNIEITESIKLDQPPVFRTSSSLGRNSLVCVSSRHKQLYIAYDDEIRVFGISDVPKYLFSLINTYEGQRHPTNMYHSAIINRLTVGLIGNAEVLVALDGNGLVWIRYTSSLTSTPMLIETGSSAWGVAFAPRHKLIAISSNRHEIDVFDMTKSIGEGHAIIELEDNIPFVSIQDDNEVLILAGTIDGHVALCEWQNSTIDKRWVVELSYDDRVWSGLIIPFSEFRDIPIADFRDENEIGEGSWSESSVIMMVATEDSIHLICNDRSLGSIPVDNREQCERLNMMFLLPGMHRVLVAGPSGHHAFIDLISTWYQDSILIGCCMTRERILPATTIVGMAMAETDYGIEIHSVSYDSEYTKTMIFKHPHAVSQCLLSRPLGKNYNFFDYYAR